MNKTKGKTYAFWIALSEGAGLLSGLLARGAMQNFNETVTQPPLSPPAILFPIVWTLLYALMGIGAARIRLTHVSTQRSHGINLFIAQLTINFFWSLIFFNAQAYGFAFLWLLLLLALVIWMLVTWRKLDPIAAKLQIPYLIWLTFAACLNFGVWYLNR